jgi:hypothetical protein
MVSVMLSTRAEIVPAALARRYNILARIRVSRFTIPFSTTPQYIAKIPQAT